MAQEGWSTRARFRYTDPQGRMYAVLAEPDDPMRFQRVPMWQGFRVDAWPEDKGSESVTNWFMLTIEFGELMPGQPDPSDSDIRLKWLRALRRYGLHHTLASLDAGTLADTDCTITSNKRDELSAWLHRTCEFLVPGVSGTLCGVNADDNAATTQTICQACGLPDIWERCKNVCNVRTHPITTDQEGIVKRECTALCELGKQPPDAGGVPHQCRWGDLTPSCFEPQLLQAERRPKRGPMGFSAAQDS